MKKLIIGFLFIVVLSACNLSEAGVSLKEVNRVPEQVKETIDVNKQLQLNSEGEGENEYYIIFHSDGNVTADIEEQGEKAIIKFDVDESKSKEKIENLYYLTIVEETEKIIVLLNGEPAAFDVIEG